MAVPEDTDKRKCDALLAFSSWALRTRSACLRIFNTPLENALFDHMLSSSPLGAGFSLSCSWLFFNFFFLFFWRAFVWAPNSSDYCKNLTLFVAVCSVRRLLIIDHESSFHLFSCQTGSHFPSGQHSVDSINAPDDNLVNFIKMSVLFPVFIPRKKWESG